MPDENPHIYFRDSTIHGTGGFARVPISPGTLVIEYVGERIDKIESNRRCSESNFFIFYLDEQTNLDGSVEWNPARLLNHSCSPNCESELIDGHIWIVAKREIAVGEEITFNYGYDLDDVEEHPCHCGAANCVGYIVAEAYFPEFEKRRQLRADAIKRNG